MKYVSLVLFTLFFIACNQSKPSIEINVNEYGDIMADMVIVQNILVKATQEDRDSLKIILHKNIKDLYGISVVDYAKNILEIQKESALYKQITTRSFERLKSLENTNLDVTIGKKNKKN